MTLWQRVIVLTEAPDPAEAAQRLAQCHALVRDYPNTLPYFGAFDELDRLLAHPHVREVLPSEDRSHIGQRALELRAALQSSQPSAQTLHGDSHRKNVILTPDGPLWTDWEDTIFAPVEWDLACLVTSARVTGMDRDWAESALNSYGPYDPTALDLCIEARALFGICWLALLSADNPDRLGRLAVWLRWLRTR